MYWVAQNVCLGFFIRQYRRIWTNLLAIPVLRLCYLKVLKFSNRNRHLLRTFHLNNWWRKMTCNYSRRSLYVCIYGNRNSSLKVKRSVIHSAAIAPSKYQKSRYMFWKQGHGIRSLETHRLVGKIDVLFFFFLIFSKLNFKNLRSEIGVVRYFELCDSQRTNLLF